MAGGGRTDPTEDRDLRTQVRMAHQTRLPAWWTRSCSGTQSLSTAARAGRTGSSSFEAMHLRALHRWACSWERAERSTDQVLNATHASGGIVLHAALLHAGHAVQDDGPHARGERRRAGELGGMESSGLEPTSLTRSAGLLQELLKFCFGSEIAACTANRPLRESQW